MTLAVLGHSSGELPRGCGLTMAHARPRNFRIEIFQSDLYNNRQGGPRATVQTCPNPRSAPSSAAQWREWCPHRHEINTAQQRAGAPSATRNLANVKHDDDDAAALGGQPRGARAGFSLSPVQMPAERVGCGGQDHASPAGAAAHVLLSCGAGGAATCTGTS